MFHCCRGGEAWKPNHQREILLSLVRDCWIIIVKIIQLHTHTYIQYGFLTMKILKCYSQKHSTKHTLAFNMVFRRCKNLKCSIICKTNQAHPPKLPANQMIRLNKKKAYGTASKDNMLSIVVGGRYRIKRKGEIVHFVRPTQTLLWKISLKTQKRGAYSPPPILE